MTVASYQDGAAAAASKQQQPALDATVATSPAQVEQKLTEIQQFYERTSVFITGGTGFLGKSKYRMRIFPS